ncbi:MAG: fatty acid cis/trans isomerase [Gammaproteobacteria bacterium]
MLNEREPQANREGSVLYRMLAMKRNRPWPGSGLLPSEHFDLFLTRAQYCPSIEEFDRVEQEHPEWGMSLRWKSDVNGQGVGDSMASWQTARTRMPAPAEPYDGGRV